MLDRIFKPIDEDRAYVFAKGAVALMLVWFGAMNFTSVGEDIVTGWLTGHAFLSPYVDQAFIVAMIIGGIQLVLGLALVVTGEPLQKVAAISIAGYCVGALSLLFFADIWAAGQGGFPFLGAGQGVIKYLAIMGVALYLAAETQETKRRALIIILSGLALVLVWIGGLKFFEFEADAIRPLLATSPFFSWLLEVFDKQDASNFIGIFEIVTAAALFFGWFFQRTVFYIGAVMAVITFLGTLSFLFTLPGWQESLGGFPALSGAGHFLLKDLVLLAGTLVLAAEKQ